MTTRIKVTKVENTYLITAYYIAKKNGEPKQISEMVNASDVLSAYNEVINKLLEENKELQYVELLSARKN